MSITVSALSSAALGVINYDLGVATPRGAGVTVMMIDSQVDVSKPIVSEMDFSFPVQPTLVCRGVDSDPGDCSDHASIVAVVLGGRHEGFIFGPAFESSYESINLRQLFDLGDYTYRGSLAIRDSDAFLISNSWGIAHVHVVSISAKRAREQCSSYDDDDCREGYFAFEAPFTESRGYIYSRQKSWLKDAGRLGVWAMGNDGFNSEQGKVDSVDGYHSMRIREALDTSEYPEDGLTRYLTDMLYARGGWTDHERSFGQESLDGYVLAVAAVDHYALGTADRLGLPYDYPTVTLTMASYAYRGYERVLTTSVAIREIGMARYSNACGDAKDHCLAAPGWTGFRFSTAPSVTPLPDGVLPGRSQGTSIATPMVSAAAVLLKSAWPHLGPPAVSTILLTTATDLGAPGVDDEYGHGLLNVSASFEPLGGLTTSLGLGLADAKVAAGPALDQALAASDATFGMSDAMGRPYLYRLAGRAGAAASDLSEVERLSRAAMSLAGTDMAGRIELAGDGAGRLGAGSRVSARHGGWTLRTGLDRCHPSCAQSPASHAMSLVPSAAVAWAQSGSRGLGGGRMGLVVEAGLDDAGQALTYTKAGLFHTIQASGALLRLEAGSLAESDTFMGSGFGRAFGVADGEGLYATARLGVPLGAGLGLGASYTHGSMGTSPLPGGMVAKAEDVGYDGFRLSAGGDGWEAYHAAPVAATSGRLRIDSVGGYVDDGGSWSVVDTADGVALQGEVSHENWRFREDREWVDLGGGARERVSGLVLGRSLGEGTLSLGLEHVTNSPSKGFSGDEGRFALSFALEL